MNAFERFAMKEYVKQNGPTQGIDDSAISEFCTGLKIQSRKGNQ